MHYHNIQQKEGHVTFQVIARERQSGKILAFQEKSKFYKDHLQEHELKWKHSSTSRKKISKEKSSGEQCGIGASCWYYKSGEIEALDEETTKELSKQIPTYSTITTIRDQWE